MEKELICRDCNMLFHSAGLLEKHKALFCIGGEVEHLQVQSHSSQPPTRNRAGGLDPKQTRTPDLLQLKGQQRNNSRWRAAPPRAEHKPATSQRGGAALPNLSDEVGPPPEAVRAEQAALQFLKLRTSVEENVPQWSNRTDDAEASVRHLAHSERLKEMREMATLHGRQLALIHAHNQQLEQQREELAHQASILAEQSDTAHLESLLLELRQQEESNDETLQQLGEHLRALHIQEACAPAHQPDPYRNKKICHDNCELVSAVDGPLSTQIKALRHAYMQSGGSDPAIVAQMIDLQAEAKSLEKNQPTAAAAAAAATTTARKKRVKPPERDPNWDLLLLEQENQRLEEEILRIQLSRQRRRDYGAAVKTDLNRLQRENLQQIAGLQAGMERRKQGYRPERPPPPPPPLQLKTHSHAPPPLLQTRCFSSPFGGYALDSAASLGPAPYDPAAGFVVFYDLLLGVDPSQKVLRLVSALYLQGQEVGPPTPLPPVQCLSGAPLPYHHSFSSGNNATLSIKQPVPRLQPSPSLSLLVEVQAAGDLDVYNQEVFKMASLGWTRLELFDQFNQLHSGHWRVPVRSLPIRPSLSIAQLNSISQVGNMELCVRLVNSRDGDVQSLTKPDPHRISLYKYPPLVPCLPATAHGNAAPLDPSQATTVDQFTSLLPVTDQPSPPGGNSQNQTRTHVADN